jgi:1,3-beta-glucan synthase component
MCHCLCANVESKRQRNDVLQKDTSSFGQHGEISFVTVGQRVLTRPLHIRFHYSHPDISDKLFSMTRGGIEGNQSSEDIFAGYNNALRAVFRILGISASWKTSNFGMIQIYISQVEPRCCRAKSITDCQKGSL